MMRDQWLEGEIRRYGYRRVAEIGVDSGTIYQHLFRACDLDLYVMVEPFVQQRLLDTIKRCDKPARLEPPYRYQEMTRDPLLLMRMRSDQAAPLIKDAELDLVFIDGAHNYEHVKDDIQAWWPKLIVGGMMCGHDYFPEIPAVKRAVDELFGEEADLYCENPKSPKGGNHIWYVLKGTEDGPR